MKWGDDQAPGATNCQGVKPYLAMLDDTGATEYTVVGSGNATTPYFEMVKVTISGTQGVQEGDSPTITVTRTGSTSYALTVTFGVTGNAEFSPSRDFSISSATTWVSIPSSNSSANITVWTYIDGLTEFNEDAIFTLSTTPTNYMVGTANVATVTINANQS